MKNQLNYEYVAEPCRNFCIFASAIITDPADGKEKIILSNFSEGGTGCLIFIDPKTGEHETVMLPGDEGAWALLNYKNEKLYVGTCSKYGYLHTYDLKNRKWLPSLRSGNELYIWNLALGSDGMIYGGTWPGCALLQCDPEKQTLRNLGKPSVYPDNEYVRTVNGDVPGYLILSCGHEVTEVILWEIGSGKKKVLGKPGSTLFEVTDDHICLLREGKIEFYRRDNFVLEKTAPYSRKKRFGSWADGCVGYVGKLKNGRLVGIRGQEYFVADDPDTVPEFKRIPGEAPVTSVMTLIEGKDGNLWGSTSLGQTIFRYNTATGEMWNSPQVCNNGGEVYGMRFADGKLFLSTYAGGDHVVYDPEKPWDQYRNLNPRTLKSVGPDLIRPTGKSVIGPDGNFWTGWSARYGIYGGGLSRVDKASHEVSSWYDPVPGQQIAGLDSDGKYLYFTTNGEASGRNTKTEPFSLCVWDTVGKIVWQHVFEKGIVPGVVLAADGFLLVTAGKEIWIYRAAGMKFLHKLPVGAFCTCLVRLKKGKFAVFCGTSLFFIEAETGVFYRASELPGPVGISGIGGAALASDGNLYFTVYTKLYRFSGADMEDTLKQ